MQSRVRRGLPRGLRAATDPPPRATAWSAAPRTGQATRPALTRLAEGRPWLGHQWLTWAPAVCEQGWGRATGRVGKSTARGPAPTPDPHPCLQGDSAGAIPPSPHRPGGYKDHAAFLPPDKTQAKPHSLLSISLTHRRAVGGRALGRRRSPFLGPPCGPPKGDAAPGDPEREEAVLRPLGHTWPAPSPPRIPLHHSQPLPDCGTPLHTSLSPAQPLPETQLPHQPAFPRGQQEVCPRALTQVVAPRQCGGLPASRPPPASPRSQLWAGHATSMP